MELKWCRLHPGPGRSISISSPISRPASRLSDNTTGGWWLGGRVGSGWLTGSQAGQWELASLGQACGSSQAKGLEG